MKNNYICNCEHYDFFNKNFLYWENRKVTSDEKSIIKYIEKQNYKRKLNILHIGVGNSYTYEKLNLNHSITGITISKGEIRKSLSYNDDNYKVFYCDKISKNFRELFSKNKFDIIIDNNLKSYSCCQKSFEFMFENFVKILNNNGIILSNKNGMNWVKKLKPKISFNLKNFFHHKIREIDGNIENIFSMDEANKMSNKFSLKLIFDNDVVIFSK